MVELLGIDHEEWQKELAEHKKFFDSLGGVVPEELLEQREQLGRCVFRRKRSAGVSPAVARRSPNDFCYRALGAKSENRADARATRNLRTA